MSDEQLPHVEMRIIPIGCFIFHSTVPITYKGENWQSWKNDSGAENFLRWFSAFSAEELSGLRLSHDSSERIESLLSRVKTLDGSRMKTNFP